ncbi:MAG: hypothetical protein AAF623_14930 [Planctomycetota bacterium]
MTFRLQLLMAVALATNLKWRQSAIKHVAESFEKKKRTHYFSKKQIGITIYCIRSIERFNGLPEAANRMEGAISDI